MEFITSNLPLIAIGICLLFVLSIIIGMRNSIIRQKNQVKRAWADVVAYQLKKLKVIPLIEDSVRKYTEFERSVHLQIAEVRSTIKNLQTSAADGVVDVKKLAAAEQASKNLLAGMNATFENYPNLRSSELYNSYFRELSEAQENITAAIAIFNGAVQYFNNTLEVFPSNLINSIFNHQKPVNEFSDAAASAEIAYRPNI